MKLILLLIFVSTCFSQNSDYALIEKTVNYYLEGGTNNNYETTKKSIS